MPGFPLGLTSLSCEAISVIVVITALLLAFLHAALGEMVQERIANSILRVIKVESRDEGTSACTLDEVATTVQQSTLGACPATPADIHHAVLGQGYSRYTKTTASPPGTLHPRTSPT